MLPPPVVINDEPIANFSKHKTKIGAVKMLTAIASMLSMTA